MGRNAAEPTELLEIVYGNQNLTEHGIFLFMQEVSQESCAEVISWILSENFKEKRKPSLTLVICSPGGDLNTCFAVVDVMLGSSIPVKTVGLGQIASAGLVMFLAGEKGQRILTPNTSILSHQYSWGMEGKEHELFATVKEFKLTAKRMLQHYMMTTGLPEKDVKKHLLPSKDVWLSAEEALKLGICDAIRPLSDYQKMSSDKVRKPRKKAEKAPQVAAEKPVEKAPEVAVIAAPVPPPEPPK